MNAWLDTLTQDARHALRAARAAPGFLAAAVVTLALGIGANTAVFSVVNSILLKPVSFAEPDRLVMLMITANGIPFFPAASPSQFVYFENNADTLEDLAAFTSTSRNFTGTDASARVSAAEVSEAYFRVFRAPFARGRAFTPQEDSPGGERVVVVSHGFWTSYLGADPNAVGRTVTLGGDVYTVVGIVDRGFDARELGSPEVWTPLKTDPATTDQAYLYRVAARLKPGVTIGQAQGQLAALTTAYRERFPGVLGPRAGFGALTLKESFVGRDTRTTLWVLAGAVGFVLLIACANVANLLLVRATRRRGEIGIRRALGASPLRIVHGLLVEGLMLSVAGGVLGLGMGFVAIRMLLSIDTAGLPRLGEAGTLIGLDWRVLGFTCFISIVTGLAFSLAPALASSRTDLAATINDSSGRGGGGRRRATHSTLVVVEVAAAVVLMVAAALLVRTSLALSRVNTGFNPEGLITAQTSLTGGRFETTASAAEALKLARDRVRALPGIVDAAATCCIPGVPGLGLPFNIPGRDDEGLFTGSNAVVFTTPGYFEVFEIPVLRGRGFTAEDDASAPPVAVINEALARQHWPDGADPLGDRMLIGGGPGNLKELADEPMRRIVGIVGNVRGDGPATEPGPIMYVPQAQMPDAFNSLVATLKPTTWVVRTRGDFAGSSKAIAEELRLATGLPVTAARTMDEVLFRSVSRQRLHAVLLSAFGGLAVLLAAVGIYAVMAYVVQSRDREIAIRVALGATPRRVRELIARDGLRMVGLGLAIGVAAAYLLASMLSAVLFGVQPHDVAVFVGVPAMLAVIGLLAVAIPAARAARMAATTATTR